MIGQLRGRARNPERTAMEAAAAIRHAEALGHAQPVLLAYHPIARMNPYQALLYARSWEQGVATFPLIDLDELEAVHAVAQAAGVPFVLHLHWTNTILDGAESEEVASAMLTTFLERLDAVRAGGGHVVWTAHNVLPHDTDRPELEARLQQGIVDRATAVHVMARNTPEAVAGWFSIPADKLLYVPHPNYVGAYVDNVTREQARFELDIPADERVYALLGAIKPYKGPELLLDAFDALTERAPAPRRLLVAGPPDRSEDVERFLERCELHPFVMLHAGRIPGDDMQLFLRAADLVVMPYVRSLNSGVLLLALSFGIPVVAPAVGGIADVVTPEIARTFAPGDRDSLVAALLDAETLCNPSAREAARRAALDYDAPTLSREFAQGVVARVGRRQPALA